MYHATINAKDNNKTAFEDERTANNFFMNKFDCIKGKRGSIDQRQNSSLSQKQTPNWVIYLQI